MFKRILVAVDSSQTGEQALQTAIALAVASRAVLRIVHVVDTTDLNMGAELVNQSTLTEGLLKNGQEVLDKAEISAAAAGVETETGLLTNETMNKRIPEAIAEDADSWTADLIVIGTHGRRGLSRLFLGSVAEGVVRVAARPVLLIPGK